MRTAESDPTIITLTVDNFLSSKESQENPVGYLAKYTEVDIGFKNNPVIGTIFDQSAAYKAGLKSGDLVLEIAGKDINLLQQLHSSSLISVVKKFFNTKVNCEVSVCRYLTV